MQIKKILNICSTNCLKIFEILSRNFVEVRVVGGAVRDGLLNIQSLDVDLIVDTTPEFVKKFLGSNSIDVIDTGLRFGTVTALCGGEKFEITSLREDLKCDGRHSQVKFTKDFEKDAERRDFTINALSYCPQQQLIFDYFNGLEDLKNKKVVFIGDANTRIKEDYLRILRFLRFSCKYSQTIDKKSLEACIINKEGLKKISRERIKSELDILLSIRNRSLAKILDIIVQHQILHLVFSSVEKFDSQIVRNIEKFSKILKIDIRNYSLYGLVFFRNQKIFLKDLLSLAFSKKEAQKIVFLVTKLDSIFAKKYSIEDNKNFLRSIFLKDRDLYYQFLLIIISNLELYREILLKDKLFLESLSNQNLSMPINGYDIVNLGFKDKNISTILKRLERKWIESNFLYTREELLSNFDKL